MVPSSGGRAKRKRTFRIGGNDGVGPGVTVGDGEERNEEEDDDGDEGEGVGDSCPSAVASAEAMNKKTE